MNGSGWANTRCTNVLFLVRRSLNNILCNLLRPMHSSSSYFPCAVLTGIQTVYLSSFIMGLKIFPQPIVNKTLYQTLYLFSRKISYIQSFRKCQVFLQHFFKKIFNIVYLLFIIYNDIIRLQLQLFLSSFLKKCIEKRLSSGSHFLYAPLSFILLIFPFH